MFIGTLGSIAVVINNAKTLTPIHLTHPSPDPAPSVQQEPAPQAPKSPPAPSRPMNWPSDVPPTLIIQIPDPHGPNPGIMNFSLPPGGELEFDIAPQWSIAPQELASTIEIAINDGEGFMELQRYQEKYRLLESAGGSPRWSRPRIARYRLRPGVSQQAALRLIIERESPEESRPLPPPLPQQVSQGNYYRRAEPPRQSYPHTRITTNPERPPRKR